MLKIKYVVETTTEDGVFRKNLILADTAEQAIDMCVRDYGYSPDSTYPLEMQ